MARTACLPASTVSSSVHSLGGATQDAEINKSPELSNVVLMVLLLLPGVGQNIPLQVSLTIKVSDIIIDRF